MLLTWVSSKGSWQVLAIWDSQRGRAIMPEPCTSQCPLPNQVFVGGEDLHPVSPPADQAVAHLGLTALWPRGAG